MIRPEHRYYAESEDGLEWWFGLSIATNVGALTSSQDTKRATCYTPWACGPMDKNGREWWTGRAQLGWDHQHCPVAVTAHRQ